MKRVSIFVLVIASIVVIGAGSYVVASRPIQIPQINPPKDPLAVITSAFPAKTSQIVVTASLPFAKIRSLATDRVPRQYQASMDEPDQGGLSGIHIAPNLQIDQISLTPEVNPAGPPKVNCATGIRGSIECKAFKWIIVNLLVGTVKTKSPDITETVNVDSQVSGWISAGIDSNWGLTHQEHFDVNVSRADITILGIIHVSIREQIRNALNDSAPNLIKSALDTVRDQMPIRPQVENVWKQLFAPIKIGSNPDAYVTLAPESVKLQQVAFGDADHLGVRIALEGNIATAVLSKSPSAAPVKPLPALEIVPVINPKFHLTVPVGVQLSAINPSLESLVKANAYRFADGTKIKLSSVSLISGGRHLYLKAQLSAANPQYFRGVKGTIYLKCNPAYDSASGCLKLKDIEFTAETHDVLVNVAAWLLNPEICREIEKRAVVNVPVTLDKVREEANAKLSAVKVLPEISLKARLDQIAFSDIIIDDDLIIVGFELSGDVNCDVSVP